MEYQMEELLPIIKELTEKYTSKESSSVSYERARELMEAVLYCMNEVEAAEGNLLGGTPVDCRSAYELGYERVVDKVGRTKKIYDRIIECFNAYGCENYQSTIIRGLPGFFLKYDPRFQPQNHILTLDYPSLVGITGREGIDLIYEYIKGIEAEQGFLSLFAFDRIERVLEEVQPDYKAIYMDNLCYPILLTAIGCVIADRPVAELYLGAEEVRRIKDYFGGDDTAAIAGKLGRICSLILNQAKMDTELKHYLAGISGEYAVRVWNGLLHDTLANVFYVTE